MSGDEIQNEIDTDSIDEILKTRNVKISKNLYRRDNIVKRFIRSSINIIKMYFSSFISPSSKVQKNKFKKMKPKERKKLKSDPNVFYSWLKETLRTELLIEVDDETFEKMFPVIAYLTHSGTFYKFIRSLQDTSLRDKLSYIQEMESFMKFNHPKHALASDREYTISHPIIKLAKFLFFEKEGCQDYFFQKLTLRKNVVVTYIT